MKRKEQYNKHKQRAHKTRRNGLIGFRYAKSARPLSRAMLRFFSRRSGYGGY